MHVTNARMCELHLAGGEFCGNACCCAAKYMHDVYGSTVCNIKICGLSILARCEQDEVTIKIIIDELIKSIDIVDDLITIVKMKGITHVLIKNDEGDYHNAKEYLRRYYKLDNKCLGIIFTKEVGQGIIQINPFVFVKACQTFINETACASGSLATALIYSRPTVKIKQPSKSEYRIDTDVQTISLQENVNLIKKDVNV